MISLEQQDAATVERWNAMSRSLQLDPEANWDWFMGRVFKGDKVNGWKGIATVLDYHPTHCQRLARENRSFGAIVHKQRNGRVWAYIYQLKEWMEEGN